MTLLSGSALRPKLTFFEFSIQVEGTIAKIENDKQDLGDLCFAYEKAIIERQAES